MFVLYERRLGKDASTDPLTIIHKYPDFDLIRTDQLTEKSELTDHFNPVVTDHLPLIVNGIRYEIPAGTFTFKGHPRTLLKFAGPITHQWLMQLKNLKVKTLFTCPHFGICVELPLHDQDFFHQLKSKFPTMIGATPYIAEMCERNLLVADREARKLAQLPSNWFDIVCFSNHEKHYVLAQLKKIGAKLISDSRYKIRIAFDKSLDKIKSIKGVKLVNAARPCVLSSYLRPTVIAYPPSNISMDNNLRGDGQIIAVADTGFDRGKANDLVHPDFSGRIRNITSWPINDSWTDYIEHPQADDGAADKHSGHGTHVAGLAVGDGTASQGKYAGLAPGAELVFQAIEQFTDVNAEYKNQLSSGYYLSGRPIDLRELFLEARQLGARIHVNAWGDPTHGQYTDDCYESDDFLFKHQDALVLFAAGNDGKDSNGDRRIDESSVYAPACAKNTIAIGATEGPREGVGLRSNWASFSSRRTPRFRHRSDQLDGISGEPEHIALISSAGPTADGRVKPDLCAPGTNLASARSQASNVRGWGLASPMPYYMYYGGTSMSTGVAGGFFALLRESWAKFNNNQPPSGAALKALAILGAAPVMKRERKQPEPLHIGGFGRLNLSRALPLPANQIQLIDHLEPGLHSGEVKRFAITINQPQAFTAVLTWYDAPGETLINNLNIRLTHNNRIIAWGNHPLNQVGSPDQHNNVEKIQVESLETGKYLLEVVAQNIPVGPQTFALAYHSPSAKLVELPLNWIQGIGKIYAARLGQSDIKTVGQLFGISLVELETILKRRGKSIQHLYAKLLLLQERLNQEIDAAIPASLTLNEVPSFQPENLAPNTWRALQQSLLPLIEVFDQSALKRIAIGDLFTIQLANS